MRHWSSIPRNTMTLSLVPVKQEQKTKLFLSCSFLYMKKVPQMLIASTRMAILIILILKLTLMMHCAKPTSSNPTTPVQAWSCFIHILANSPVTRLLSLWSYLPIDGVISAIRQHWQPLGCIQATGRSVLPLGVNRQPIFGKAYCKTHPYMTVSLMEKHILLSLHSSTKKEIMILKTMKLPDNSNTKKISKELSSTI